MTPKSRKQRFIEKYNKLTDVQKKEAVISLKTGFAKNVPFSWQEINDEMSKESYISKKMLNKLKHEGKI